MDAHNPPVNLKESRSMKNRILPKFLLASTALALVTSPVSVRFSGHDMISFQSARAQDTSTSADDAEKLRLEEEAKAKAAEAEAAAKEAEAEAAANAAKAAEDQKAAEEEAAKAVEDQKTTEEEARKAAEAEAAKAAETAKPAEPETTDAETAKPADNADSNSTDGNAGSETKSADETPKTAPSADTVETDKPADSQQAPAADSKPETAGDTPVETPSETTAEPATETPPATTAPATADAPPAPSADAPVAEEIAQEPIEEQIRNAEEVSTAVVPDDVTDSQRKDLKAAENRRREKARDNREELIGAAAVGVAIGALLPVLGGTVVEDQGDRFVVERDGEYYVRKDDSVLFRDRARDVTYEKLRGGRTLETVYRRNGSRIETIRDPGGYILRRVKIDRDGREIILFDSRDINDRRRVNYDDTLPPLRIDIPRDEYIVSGGRADRRSLAEIFAAPPVEVVEETYSLRDIRENVRVRDIVRRVDLDTINFDSGSFTVRNSQVPYLADVAGGILDEVEANPDAVFLIEGHTDAVGSEVSNLTLSDRRAETVGRILVEAYNVPPENLITEGYGEQYLKVETEGDERQNRRVTIRNISPLLKTAAK